MNRWIEERLEAIRLALGIRGYPGEADLLRLVEWLGANVEVRHEPVALPLCARREDGSCVLYLPEELAEPRYSAALCHEIAHALLAAGVGSLLRGQDPASPRLERLARRWDLQDEARAAEFVSGWVLPSALVAASPCNQEVAERASCPVELVAARRRSLSGQVVRLARPPLWCAHHLLQVKAQRCAAGPLLYVTTRGGSEPLFSFPAPAGSVRRAALQLQADLVALTPDEFALKHHGAACGPVRPVELSLEELAGRLSRG